MVILIAASFHCAHGFLDKASDALLRPLGVLAEILHCLCVQLYYLALFFVLPSYQIVQMSGLEVSILLVGLEMDGRDFGL